MVAGFNNCQVIEAIQNLPPELQTLPRHKTERVRGFGLEPGSQ